MDTSPEFNTALEPLDIITPPPEEASLAPATSFTFPPLALAPEEDPAAMLILPDIPVEEPVVKDIPPESPAAASPVLTSIPPLVPVPDPLLISTAPLVTPLPLKIFTEPPSAPSLFPAEN